ncbi:low molecular weight phosphotyrosine protein phosphatase [Corynebacterium sp. zg254]|uniref:low molecular weight protein-tyrosine-phosphatase n=1 Tax=Corynebacterium sp. zg254 TaxID=2656645 RepID=UPI002151E8B7|nr:low molecular weight protein-tyrosine-phosphatase [Corynebacterium sp. zg254]MCR5914505.1 low molecular weight phosphotyrosine protein phosphatase [Corynebacterium sp. zg254]
MATNTIITVVCTGNICRSPMGEIMLRDYLAEHGIEGITVNSCGMANYHVGDGADPRAIKQLDAEGHDGTQHVASQFGADYAGSDALLAMDEGHARGLIRAGVDPKRVFLHRAFDPESWTGDLNSLDAPETEDPYYGNQSDFARVAQEIKAALPGIAEHFQR